MKRRRTVDLERLNAAREAMGLSWPALAKAAHLSQPSLSRLRRGRVQAVNPSTLERLATALRVPAPWLMGALDELPYVPEWDATRRKGSGHSFWERPTAELIRWSWLLQRIDKAIHRDLAEFYRAAEAKDAYDVWGRHLLVVFAELSSSISWRTACLVPRAGSWQPLLQPEESSFITWLEQLLEPWLDGRAYLNATVVDGLFDALCSNPDRLWGSKTRDAEARRALREYASLSQRNHERATAQRLEAELGPEPEE